MTSFSDPRIESIFATLTAIQERLTGLQNDASGTAKQRNAIGADLAGVCESLVKLFTEAEKTESFKAEFAQLEGILSAVLQDFNDGGRPRTGSSVGWMQVFRWSGARVAWTALLFLVARSWRMGDGRARIISVIV